MDFWEERLGEIASLLLSGQKLAAIKVYREATGASLDAAKKAIEQIERVIRGYSALPFAGKLPDNAANADAQNMLLTAMAHLISQGEKLQAIKLYRERTGLGLIEAKRAVDQLDLFLRAQKF